MRYTRAQQQHGHWQVMAFLPSCLGMGGYWPSRHFLDGSPSRIKMGKTAWSIASPSFALGWERCHQEEKLPSLIQRKLRQPPACQAPWHVPAQPPPAPPVCAMGLQLRQAVPRKITPQHKSRGAAGGARSVCILHFVVSL